MVGQQHHHRGSGRHVGARELRTAFDQYLRSIMVPVLEYNIEGDQLTYRWSNVVPGFDMPIKVTSRDSVLATVPPTPDWKSMTVHLSSSAALHVDRTYYVI